VSGAIDPGRFRQRLMLRRLVETPDSAGGFDSAWSDVAQVWARIEPVSDLAEERAGTREAAVTHAISVRQRDGIVAGARFQLGTRAFDIASVRDPDESGRYFLCACREAK
jgi:SPP1 family predicted phage head-tail adaptor